MTITLKVYNTSTFIVGYLSSEVYKSFKKALGYKDPQAIWKHNAGKWDGIVSTVCYNKKYCKCPIKKDGIHFPTGLFSKAKEFFDYHNISYFIQDCREKISIENKWISNPTLPPYDYQEETIDKACERTRGIIKIATGGGKTRVCAGIIAKLGVYPFIFYVTSKDLLKQAHEELQRFILENGSSVEVGVIGDGKCVIKDINVMTVQTAARVLGEDFDFDDDEEKIAEEDFSEIDKKKEEIYNLIINAKGIIADECQYWSAKSCQIITGYSDKAKYKYGASATPTRDLGDDILIEACFGKTIVDINASYLIDRGFLVPPTIYFIHTKKYKTNDSYQYVYKNFVVENEERNLLVCQAANKLVSLGRQALILVKNISHGEILEEMIDGSFFMNGSHSSKDRNAHIQKMRERKMSVTISTSIFDTGVDIKALDGLVLAGSGKSSTRAKQRIGRIVRLFTDPISGYVKKDAIAFDFQDHVRYLSAHSNKRRQIYMTEPRFIIKELYPYGKIN